MKHVTIHFYLVFSESRHASESRDILMRLLLFVRSLLLLENSPVFSVCFLLRRCINTCEWEVLVMRLSVSCCFRRKTRRQMFEDHRENFSENNAGVIQWLVYLLCPVYSVFLVYSAFRHVQCICYILCILHVFGVFSIFGVFSVWSVFSVCSVYEVSLVCSVCLVFVLRCSQWIVTSLLETQRCKGL